MKKIDARKQTTDALYERRKQVIRLYRDGVPVMRIVARTGLSWSAVSAAIKLFQAEGESALKPAARGRKQGTGRILTEEQEAAIRQLIRQRRPRFYKLKDSLWTRDTVTQLIKQKYGITLSVRGVGNYLNRWGLALKKPNKRPYERCSREIRQWLDAHYVEIGQRARTAEAEIYWLNKPVAVDNDAWQCSSVPERRASSAVTTEKKQMKRWIVSVVSNQGKVRWMISNGAFTSDRQRKFMRALIKDTRKKVLFLIRCDWYTYRSCNSLADTRQNSPVINVFPAPEDRMLNKVK